jgi:hypothetical protein
MDNGDARVAFRVMHERTDLLMRTLPSQYEYLRFVRGEASLKPRLIAHDDRTPACTPSVGRSFSLKASRRRRIPGSCDWMSRPGARSFVRATR